MSTDYGRDGVPTEKVHVRQLGVVDTLRWSWEVLKDRPELVGLTFAASLLSAVPSFGITPAPDPSGTPSVEPWVFPLYLVYLLVIAVVWGVVFLTADDGVVERTRPLGTRLKIALRRIPALLFAGIVALVGSTFGLLLFVVPGVYLFHRFLLSFPAIFIDEKGPFSGLSAGWTAAGGNIFKVFLVSVIYFVASFSLAIVSTAFGVVGSLVSSIVSAGLFPLFGLALGHLYLEQDRNQ